jgi:hypothetical protein
MINLCADSNTNETGALLILHSCVIIHILSVLEICTTNSYATQEAWPSKLSLHESRIFNDAVSVETTASMVGWIINECGAVGRMLTGRENVVQKPTLVLLCSPQIPYDLIWDQTQATTTGSQWSNASTMAWLWTPYFLYQPTV